MSDETTPTFMSKDGEVFSLEQVEEMAREFEDALDALDEIDRGRKPVADRVQDLRETLTGIAGAGTTARARKHMLVWKAGTVGRAGVVKSAIESDPEKMQALADMGAIEISSATRVTKATITTVSAFEAQIRATLGSDFYDRVVKRPADGPPVLELVKL